MVNVPEPNPGFNRGVGILPADVGIELPIGVFLVPIPKVLNAAVQPFIKVAHVQDKSGVGKGVIEKSKAGRVAVAKSLIGPDFVPVTPSAPADGVDRV